ncbi:MAG: hypothetical protein V4692_13485 [Bdellovibrionota bacterium]
MKFCAFVFVLLAAVASQAMPSVGDTSILSVYSKTHGVNLEVRLELTQFDSSSQSFKQVTTTSLPGYPSQVEEEWVAGEDLLSGDSVEYILANCSQIEGLPQTVATAAGNFETCQLKTQDSNGGTGVVNIGRVPFGIVTGDTADASMSIRSFQFGR